MLTYRLSFERHPAGLLLPQFARMARPFPKPAKEPVEDWRYDIGPVLSVAESPDNPPLFGQFVIAQPLRSTDDKDEADPKQRGDDPYPIAWVHCNLLRDGSLVTIPFL